jgi:hypothetical protein
LCASRSHFTNSHLQDSACLALVNLCAHSSFLDEIDKAGGIDCIVAAMQGNPTNRQGGRLQAAEDDNKQGEEEPWVLQKSPRNKSSRK